MPHCTICRMLKNYGRLSPNKNKYHSFIQKKIYSILYSRHCSRDWEYSDKWDRLRSCSHGDKVLTTK